MPPPWTPQGVATVPVRVIRKAPDELTSFGAARILSDTTIIDVRVSEILNSHDKGVLIRSKNGFYLAIPTPAAGKGRGGARLTPGEWEQRRGIKLRFIYRRNAPSLLVTEKARINTRGTAVASRSKTGRGQVSAPIFILVPQVK